MKVLVTSGNGLVGSWIKKIVSSNSDNKYYFHNRNLGDLTAVENVKKVLGDFLPDIIIHNAAALNGSLDSDDAKELNAQLNMKMYKNLIYNIRPDQKMICFSSYHVFSETAPFKFLQSEELSSKSIYATEKSSEIYLAKKLSNIQFILFPHLFGINDNYRDKRAHFIANSIKRIYLAKLNKDKELAYFGSIDQVLQYATGEQAANFAIKTINDENLMNQQYINGNIGWVANSYLVFKAICDIIGFNGNVFLSSNIKKERDMFFSGNSIHSKKLPPDFQNKLLSAYKSFVRTVS